MTAAMDQIEKLLHDADGKFMEKLKLCQSGVATNMNIYSDRTYNLRQQIAHNPQLTGDDHFMEMLADTEQALAPEFTLRGEADRKLTSLLCGLLKTLLREAATQPMYSLRKIQIEMIWQWYGDKKRNVLDYAIGLQRSAVAPGGNGNGRQGAVLLTSSSANANGVPAPHSTSPTSSPSQSTSAAALKPSSTAALPSGTSGGVFSGSDAGGSHPSSTGAPTAASKFGSRLRQFVEVTTSAGDGPGGPAAPGAHSGSSDLCIRGDATAATQALVAKKFSLYRKRNLQKAERLRQELGGSTSASTHGGASASSSEVKVVYTKEAKLRQKRVADARSNLIAMRHGPSGPPSFWHHDSKAPCFSREPLDDLEMRVANAHQHILRSLATRLSDENDARELRDSMSLFEFNKSRLEEETNRRLEAETYSSQLGRTCHTILRKVPATATSAAEKPMRFNIGVDGTKSTAHGIGVGGATMVTDGSLSKPLGSSESTTTVAGASHTSIAVTYSGTATSLSPYDARATMDEARLRDALLRHQPQSSAESRPVRPSSAPASIHHSRLISSVGLDVVLAADAKVSTTGPRLDVPLVEQLLSSNSGDISTPSLRRVEELKLANRVRDAFAGTRKADRPSSAHHYPRSKIERAIVTPDDDAAADCMRLLPSYSSFLPRRPQSAIASRR